MIRKIILLLSLAVWMLSCQQDDTDFDIGNDIAGSGEGIPVKISLSIEDAIENQTGYIPMKAGTEDEVKLKISNQYRIIIMKKIGDKIIIDSLAIGVANKNTSVYGLVSFKEGENFDNLSLVLTPGEYRLSIFTGQNAMQWNSHIKKGGVVADNTQDGTHTYACTYGIGANSYSNVGVKYLQEEIFSGTTSFTVNKTEDLHSNPDPALDNIKITLKRNVTKYRIVLHDNEDVDPDDAFENNGDYGKSMGAIIRGNMTAIDDTKFVDGLDIWGAPWYDQTPTTEMVYCTETKDPMIALDDGKYFFSTPGARVHAPYFFSKEGADVKVVLSNIRVNFGSQRRYYEYYYTVNSTLIHSHIDGIIFQPGDYTDNSNPPVTNMVLEMDNTGINPRNPLELFNSYAEYNYLQN